MNNEELQQELNLQFPSEIAGIKRPTEPVESKHDFFLKMPQLISKDPVLYNKMNLLFSILLSNDNALKQNIDTILGKLDNDYAQLDSPEFSGIPTVPTPEEQDNSKKITNTEWVQAWVKAFVAELSNNIEVETQEDGHFSCPALGITGLMAQNGYICLGKLFGNLILQWGLGKSTESKPYTVDITLNILANTLLSVATDMNNTETATNITGALISISTPCLTKNILRCTSVNNVALGHFAWVCICKV